MASLLVFPCVFNTSRAVCNAIFMKEDNNSARLAFAQIGWSWGSIVSLNYSETGRIGKPFILAVKEIEIFEVLKVKQFAFPVKVAFKSPV